MEPEELEIEGFEWDPDKTETNLAKHGVSFEEAEEAVEQADLISDPYKTRGEVRYLVVGPSSLGRMLQVVITIRGLNARIISARRYPS
ncbi:BrnT family toxin [bacterium]|nr:BrnT family toxin [bacterium]